MRITYDGKIGIGTSNPSDALEVVGNIQAISNQGYIGVGQTASRPFTNMFYHSATGNAGFGVNLYYNGTNWVYANTAGHSGHGMAWRMFPSSRLSLYHAGNGANPAVVSELFTVTNGGNVGVGKSNPAYPLDVVGDIALTGQIHDASDRRLKDNIKPLHAGQLKKLAALQGVSFVMKGSEQTELGLIAQDVEPHFPELVQTRPDGMKTLSYLGFIAPMIEAFKEQQTQLELLQEQVEQLQSQLRQISSQDQPE